MCCQFEVLSRHSRTNTENKPENDQATFNSEPVAQEVPVVLIRVPRVVMLTERRAELIFIKRADTN